MSLSCSVCRCRVCVVSHGDFCCLTKGKVEEQLIFRLRLEMLAACTFFPSVISRKPSEKFICYYAGFVFLLHMHVGTETKPTNLSPVQSSVRAHCFEVTTHPLRVDLRGSGHKAKVNGITQTSVSALRTLPAVFLIPRWCVCGQYGDGALVSPACHQVVAFGKQSGEKMSANLHLRLQKWRPVRF